MKRTLALLILPAVLLLPACSGSTGAAATVDGSAISTKTLMADIHDFSESQTFVDQLAQQELQLVDRGPSRKGEPRSAAMAFTTQWLTSLVQNEAIAQIAKTRKVSATGEEVEQAEAELGQQAGPTWTELPARLRKRIVAAQALQNALRASLPAAVTEEVLAQAYTQLEADCPSGLLIAHILVATEAEADAAIERLDAGESFAQVATDVSTDQGSAAQAGLLTCSGSSQWAQFDPTFTAAADELGADEVSPPVTTQFGVHVITALPLTPQNAQPLVRASAQPPDPLAALVRRYLARHTIWVNSRFGTVDRSEGFTIVPPTPVENVRRLPKEAPAAPATGGTGGTGTPGGGATPRP